MEEQKIDDYPLLMNIVYPFQNISLSFLGQYNNDEDEDDSQHQQIHYPMRMITFSSSTDTLSAWKKFENFTLCSYQYDKWWMDGLQWKINYNLTKMITNKHIIN